MDRSTFITRSYKADLRGELRFLFSFAKNICVDSTIRRFLTSAENLAEDGHYEESLETIRAAVETLNGIHTSRWFDSPFWSDLKGMMPCLTDKLDLIVCYNE